MSDPVTGERPWLVVALPKGRVLEASLAALSEANDLLAVPVDEGPPLPLSGALAEFAAGDAFKAATEQQAKSLRQDPSALREEWLALLRRVEVAGRRPATPSDYLFIFESIRRAVEP